MEMCLQYLFQLKCWEDFEKYLDKVTTDKRGKILNEAEGNWFLFSENLSPLPNQ